MKTAEKVDDQDYYEDRSKADAGSSTIAPATMAVVAAATAKKQDQENNQQ
jgi:hypothetical protein